MKIEDINVKLSFNRDELYDLSFMIMKVLNNSIESHYNCLQQNKDGESVFFDYEKGKIKMLKTFTHLNARPDEYDYFIKQCKDKFEKKRKEREEKK